MLQKLIEWIKWQLGIGWDCTVSYWEGPIRGPRGRWRAYRNRVTGEIRKVYW